MRAFRYVKGHYEAEFDEVERLHLGNLIAQVAVQLGSHAFNIDRHDARMTLSHDIVARLLPQASEDERIAAEFAALTHEGLVSTKITRLEWLWQLLQGGGEVLTIPAEDFPKLNASLNDLRLALATQLDIHDEDGATRVYHLIEQPADPQADEAQANEYLHASFYTALTWLQETLMTAWQNEDAQRGEA